MPYCIHCGQQYQQPANFCTACGKRLPAPVAPVATKVAATPAPLSRNGKIFMLLLAAFVIIMGTISIVLDNASHKKTTEREEKKEYVTEEAVRDTAVAIMPEVVEDSTVIAVIPDEAVPPAEVITPPAASDTATPPPPPPVLPSYVKTDGGLSYNSPCFVIVTAFYFKEKLAQQEAKRLQARGYNAAFSYMGYFTYFEGKDVYATVIGPYETYSECQKALRTLPRVGPFWYGVKLSYDKELVKIDP
jgi:hypothetical protein